MAYFRSPEDEWMDTLKIEWEDYEDLKEIVALKFNRKYPIPDPDVRLKLTLRYLATGQGFEESHEQMLIDTMKEIFNSISEHSLVRTPLD